MEKGTLEELKHLYVEGNLAKTKLARTFNIPLKDLNKLIQDGNWELLRNSKKVSKQELLQQFYRQLDAINKEIEKHKNIPTKALTDHQSNVLKGIEKFTDQPFHIYIDVSYEFTEYLASIDPVKALEFGEIFNNFLMIKMKQGG